MLLDLRHWGNSLGLAFGSRCQHCRLCRFSCLDWRCLAGRCYSSSGVDEALRMGRACWQLSLGSSMRRSCIARAWPVSSMRRAFFALARTNSNMRRSEPCRARSPRAATRREVCDTPTCYWTSGATVYRYEYSDCKTTLA